MEKPEGDSIREFLKDNPDAERVLRCLLDQAREGATSPGIARLTGLDLDRVKECLQQLRTEGLVDPVGLPVVSRVNCRPRRMPKKTIAAKLEYLPVLCQMCGKKFRTKYPTRARYCSEACRSRWKRVHRRYRSWLALNGDKPTNETQSRTQD